VARQEHLYFLTDEEKNLKNIGDHLSTPHHSKATLTAQYKVD